MERSRPPLSGTLPSELVQEVAVFAASHGWDVPALLREAGIPNSPSTRITEAQGVRLVQMVWRLTDDEAFGMADHPLPRGSFRLLCYGVIGAPDLGSALKRLEGFTDAIPAVASVRMSPVGPEEPDLTRIALGIHSVSNPEHRVLVWTAMAVVHRVSAWAIGRPLDLVRVEFPTPPLASSELADKVFGAPQVYRADSVALVLKTRDLSAAIVRDTAALDDFIASSPASLLRRTSNRHSNTAERVRTLIQRDIRAGRPQAGTIAKRLHMSPATLRRQLAAESTSLREIRDTALRDAAIVALTEGEAPIAQIAADLGFSESSAFTRAFRRWTGHPPSVYRGEH
ncbi:AraC family transcriptional regulator [Streptomyces chartreusis]|uniref:AraC family transcriptional regulator n=1 Tax=Streptomyces chartreusis TaxID=1969 RepID=UPI00368EBBF8